MRRGETFVSGMIQPYETEVYDTAGANLLLFDAETGRDLNAFYMMINDMRARLPQIQTAGLQRGSLEEISLSTNRSMLWESPDDGEDAVRLSVIPRNARLGGSEPGLSTLKELTRGHVRADMSPEHCEGVQPGTVCGPREPDQPSSGASYYGLDVRILMGGRHIPGHIDGLCRMFFEQGLAPCGARLAPLMAPAAHHGCPGMIVDGSHALRCGRLSWGRHHAWLALRAPQGPESRHP
jgi:hypothetical protein